MTIATCAVGGGAALAAGVPVLRLLTEPVGKTTVTTPREPFDLGHPDRFVLDAPPRKIEIVAPLLKDGWTAARDVLIGAVFIRRTGPAPGEIDARSAIRPHLGCAISYDAAQKNYLRPCHDSRFAVTGAKLWPLGARARRPAGAASASDGRLKLTWIRYKNGSTQKEPA